MKKIELYGPFGAWIRIRDYADEAVEAIAERAGLDADDFISSLADKPALVDEPRGDGKTYYVLEYEFRDGGRCRTELGYFDEGDKALYVYEGEELVENTECRT